MSAGDVTMDADRSRAADIGVRAAWLLASLPILLVFLSFYQQPIGSIAGSGLAALLVLTIVRPYAAILLFAALGPLSTILFMLAGVGAGGMRIFEAMTLAVTAGRAIRHAVRPSPLNLRPAVIAASSVLIAIAVASTIVSGGVVLAEEFVSPMRGVLAGGIFSSYAVHWDAVSASLLFAEGLVLLMATADICGGDPRRRDAVLRMMVLGAAAAAAFNLVRMMQISISREEPGLAFLNFVFSQRVNVHHGDLNAAGSYFAMMLFQALGLAFDRRARLIGVVSAPLIAAAVWMAGSRTALAAACLMTVLAAVARIPSGRPRRIAAAAAAILVIAAGVTLWTRYQSERHVATPAVAAGIRMGLAKAALRMAADNPVFGVGLGHFLERSEHYTDGPFFHGPRGHIVRENAHNNFLQILGELGIPGLVLFLVIIAIPLYAVVRAEGPVSFGLATGLGVYLLTCLGGHPMMVPHASYPFWMALGVAATVASAGAGMGWRFRSAALVLILALAASVPFRSVEAVGYANVEHTSIGFSRWQREPDGQRYRWAGGRSTFFVPSAAHSVRIPLATGTEGPDPLEVRIFLNGREANRIVLERSNEWRSVYLPLTRRVPEPFSRIDLEAGAPGVLAPLELQPTDTSGLLRVGRPVIKERE
jgi:O-antigen ligase